MEISENSFSIENIEEIIEDVQKHYENKFEEEIEITQDEKINSIFNLPKQNLANMSINLIHEKINLREIQIVLLLRVRLMNVSRNHL